MLRRLSVEPDLSGSPDNIRNIIRSATLHTHAVVANMVQGEDEKWRTMVNDGLYRNKMAIGAVYRAELAQGLQDLGYGIEKTHGDGRFEIAGVSRGRSGGVFDEAGGDRGRDGGAG